MVCCLLLEMPAEPEDLLEASGPSGSGPHAREEHRAPSQTVGGEGLVWVPEPVWAYPAISEAGSQGYSRNKEEDERLVPLKRFCKRLHKKNCFFPWELKLGEQTGRARCELVVGSLPSSSSLPPSQELFPSLPHAPSVGA